MPEVCAKTFREPERTAKQRLQLVFLVLNDDPLRIMKNARSNLTYLVDEQWTASVTGLIEIFVIFGAHVVIMVTLGQRAMHARGILANDGFLFL